MKKRFLSSMVSSILVVVFATIPYATLSYAQCRCSCHWVCAGRCVYQCSGCGLLEGAEAGARCCDSAPNDGGPCGEEENF
jgi:hypothetical protein